MGNFQNYVEKKENNNIIETGYNVNSNFWHDFLLVLNNNKGISDLLDIPSNKVSTWNKKINQALKDYENKKKDQIIQKKHKIIKTGIPSIRSKD